MENGNESVSIQVDDEWEMGNNVSGHGPDNNHKNNMNALDRRHGVDQDARAETSRAATWGSASM